jgi:hypothetical protein
LESDLLDALDEKLNPKSAAKSPAASTQSAAAKSLPDSPSATGGSPSFFNAPRLTTAPSEAKAPVAKPPDAATAKRLQVLNEKAQSLEQILHNQAHPNNLAVVKRSNTPVVAEPSDGSQQVLFQADAEDEFEVLDSTDTWVHVKISGISRGWIRREHVDLPGATTVSVAALGGEQPEAARQTKEEVGPFPGKWEPLDGKQVKIIWVQPREKDQFGSEPKWGAAKSMFRSADAGASGDSTQIAGVVVVFDSADVGMAATTLANLQQWRAGHLSDDAFWKRCWRDPAEAFQVQR